MRFTSLEETKIFNDRLTRFLSSSKRFFDKLNRLTGRQKKNGNFLIAANENKFNTDEYSGSNVFNEKFVSIGKKLTDSIPNVQITTEGLTNMRSLSLSIQLFPWKYLELY